MIVQHHCHDICHNLTTLLTDKVVSKQSQKTSAVCAKYKDDIPSAPYFVSNACETSPMVLIDVKFISILLLLSVRNDQKRGFILRHRVRHTLISVIIVFRVDIISRAS